jgi:hypothetical protein
MLTGAVEPVLASKLGTRELVGGELRSVVSERSERVLRAQASVECNLLGSRRWLVRDEVGDVCLPRRQWQWHVVGDDLSKRRAVPASPSTPATRSAKSRGKPKGFVWFI